MKRRTFLKTIASIGATLAVSPIKGIDAIAQQGVVPAFKSVQSGNTLLTPAAIVKEALKMLEDNLVMSNIVHKEYTDKAKKGTIIKIGRPPKL